MKEKMDKRKLIKFTGVSVMFMFLLIGATYAYISANGVNNFGTRSINASTSENSSITLSAGDNLILDIDLESMKDFGVDKTYFASKTGRTTTNTVENIGRIKAVGEGTYTCTYSMSVSVSGSMVEAWNSYENKIAKELVLRVDNNEYDFYNTTFPVTVGGTITNVSNTEDKFITSSMYFVNRHAVDQSALAGKNLSVNFEVTSFDCTKDNTPIEETPIIAINNELSEDENNPTVVNSNNLTLSGTVNTNAGISKVMVNGEQLSIVDNNWSKTLTLLEGTQKINVTVIDNRGEILSSTTKYVKYFKPIASTDLWSMGELQSSGLEGDGKRYFGTNPDNYICFGTSNATTCKNAPDKYMYRIIGVFANGNNKYLKLIKKEALESKMAWHSTNEDVDWGDSTLYTAINGSSFLTNTTYVPTGWSSKIANWTWTSTNTKTDESSGVHYYYTSPKGIYYSETGQNQTLCRNGSSTEAMKSCATGRVASTKAAKIGLMNASDYALSLGGTQLTTDTSPEKGAATLKTGWMHLSNNDSGAPSTAEWTISRYGNLNGNYRAWFVVSDGLVNFPYVTGTFSVRPVFYLNSTEVITGGQGTSGDPYIIG